MKVINLHDITSLDEFSNRGLLDELNSLVSEKMLEITSPNLGVFHAGESQLDNSELLALVQEIRSRCLSNVYLRGTDMKSQEEALAKGLLSTKVVDHYFEDDIGLVAAYRIPTGANNISNQYFVYKFFLTVLSSISYAVQHSVGLKGRQSVILFTPAEIDSLAVRAWDIYYSLEGKHTPEISRDTGREDLNFGGRQFAIFKENQSENAFENNLSSNKGTVINIPPYTQNSGSDLESLSINTAPLILNETEKFIYFIAHVITIILLKEIGSFSHLKEEYLAKTSRK